MDRNETGIFNVTNRGVITYKQILSIYRQLVDQSYEMPEFISVEKLKELTLAERSNCILYNARLVGKGIETRHVINAVEDCMRQYAKYNR